MILKAGYPYSLVKNGLPFDYPKLEKNTSTDVLVMGGGISGALAAHYLIREGISCMIVDARSIGLGSTCASTSLLQYEIDTPLHRLITMAGKENAVAAYRLCASAITKLEALARQTGMEDFAFTRSLYYAAYKKDISWLAKEFTIRKQYGFAVQQLGESAIYKEFGFKAPTAILSELGACTDAYLFTHHLLVYNMKRGLLVYDRTAIDSIKHHPGGVEVISRDGYRISAKKLVYATGYEVVNFIKKPIVSLHSTYASISESLSYQPHIGKKDTMIWNTANPYLYIRTTPDRRIIVGGRDEKFFSPAKRDKLIQAKAKQLKNDFNKLFPRTPFTPEFSWTGTFGSTRDGLPYIGPYRGLPNSYFSLGFGGNGITFSQVAGEIIAGLVKGKKNKHAGIFSFDRT
ncbi:MAG: FAD-binding oxidoreductase [Chitinophagaceae bacterium]